MSVVVPTYRRPALVQRCLEALLRQTLEPDLYEVIVVDNSGDLCVAELENRLRPAERNGPAIHYIPAGHVRGPAAARNAGWRAAAGDIIAFTDDDCVPDPGWLRAGLRALDSGATGASGRIVVPLSERPTDYERSAAGLSQGEFVTANCFYQREALEHLGGFDERFKAAWREDTDLFFRLLERGERLVQAPEALVVHPVRPASWGVSLRQQNKSIFNALLYKKHPRLYRERVQARAPLRYYAILVAGAGAMGFAVSGKRTPGMLAASLWAILTARFCFHRLGGASHAPSHVVEMAVTSILIPPLAVFWRLRGAIKFGVVFL